MHLKSSLVMARRDLDVDFIGLDHAQLLACTFFDHFQAFTQIRHFGFQLGVDLLRLRIRLLLLMQAGFLFLQIREAALSEPQLRLQQGEQQQQDDGDEVTTHEDEGEADQSMNDNAAAYTIKGCGTINCLLSTLCTVGTVGQNAVQANADYFRL